MPRKRKTNPASGIARARLSSAGKSSAAAKQPSAKAVAGAQKKPEAKRVSPQELVKRTKKLAYSEAKKIWWHYRAVFDKLRWGKEDVYQEALFALTRAAYKHNPRKGAFTTLAVHSIQNHFRNISRTAFRSKRKGRTVSLFTPITKDSADPLYIMLADPRRMIFLPAEVRHSLIEIVRTIPNISGRDKEIFLERYELVGRQAQTLAQIGKRFGVKPTRCGQIVQSVFVALKLDKRVEQFAHLVPAK